jgi:hypothetical protein
MTELSGDQKLERLIRVYGVEGMVVVTIRHEGISFRVKGTKKSIFAPWPDVVKACQTGTDVPSFLMGNPMALLISGAAKVVATKVKNATKGGK